MRTDRRGPARGLAALLLGALLFSAGLGLAGYNLYDNLRAGNAARRAAQMLMADAHLRPADHPATEEDVLVAAHRTLPVKSLEGRDYVGVLQLPVLSLELPVQTPYSLDALRESPCLYAGDPYRNDLVICAHNYDSHFGRLNSLRPEDELLFIAIDGQIFRYRLSTREVLPPDAVDDMVHGDDWDLTLFTCTWGGEWRIAARFVRVRDPANTAAR